MITLDIVGNVIHKGKKIPVECKFTYSALDQYAITLLADDVRWVIARDVLHEALTTDDHLEAGLGDFRVKTVQHHVYLYFSSPEGNAVVEFNKALLHQFVWDTLDLVPIGEETYDWDGILGEILD